MVTIADVAAHAGVGAGTVSRVLNDRPRVSPTTRARVLAAIELLDYRPNPLARGLSLGRCQTFGVVVPFFTHPSAVERLRGVVDALRGSDYDLVLFDVESPLHLEEHLASLTRRDRAAGLLVLSLPLPAEHLARLRSAAVPVVIVDAAGDGVPHVVTDDVEGGRIATRHLVELGHREIAFIGEPVDNPFGFTSSARRQAGYEEVLRANGLRVRRGHIRHGSHDRAIGRALTEGLLAQRVPPTAVFAASDALAIGALEAARAAGLRVPGDLSVVGFDDIDVSAYAGLTTVRQPLYESGRLGATLLLDALAGGSMPSEAHRLGLELVQRSTTGPPARRRQAHG
jgi:LacI family transcriptional regulator